MSTDTTTAYRFGRHVFMPARRQLLTDGAPVSLGARAIDLLEALIERRGRVATKSELLDAVWPGVVVEEANLPVQVNALRKALGATAIATVPGRGYRFVAALDGGLEGAAPGPAHGALTAAASGAALLPGAAGSAAALVGRERELADLLVLTAAQPLVSVVGAGGIGKTRLAQALAAASAARWRDGVTGVDAAVVHDAALLSTAVAQALQLKLADPRSMPAVAAALAARAMLLIVDNCEHLVDAAAALVQALRQAAPGVHMLLTSQQALGIDGESVYRLAPLALPGAGDVADERFGALALFVLRARQGGLAFAIDDGNRQAVAEICRQLDGLPLAIELAAARVGHLGLTGLQQRLGQRLQLLTRSPRGLPTRHLTLQAALDWSYGLLDRHEQAVLRRLGVFVGGFTVELAQRVCSPEHEPDDEWAVLDAVAALIDKSLVSADAGGDPPRLRLLETVRLFALQRLAEAGETDAVRQRHAQAVTERFVAVEASHWDDDRAPGSAIPAATLQPELDNARAALDWTIAAADWPLAVALGGSAAAHFALIGLTAEVVPLLRRLLPHLHHASAVAQVALLWRLGTAGRPGGMSHDELLAVKQQAVGVARQAGLRRRLQMALAGLGFAHASAGDVAAAQAVLDEMQALARPADPAIVQGVQLTVEMMIHEQRRDLPAVVACLQRQRALLSGEPAQTLPLMICESNLVVYLNALGRDADAAELGCRLLARADLPRDFLHAVCATAYALAALGQTDRARALLLQRQVELRVLPISQYSGEALAMLCLAQGRLADAVRIAAALDARLAANGARPVHPLTRAFHVRLAAAIDAAGAAAAANDWRVEGRPLSDAAAVGLALAPA